MGNTPNFRTKLSFAEYAERRRTEGSVAIELPDGDPVVIPPPEFWPKEVTNMFGRMRQGRADHEEIAQLILGGDDFDRFAAVCADAGVSRPGYVLFGPDGLYEEATRQAQGVSTGES